MLDQDPFPDQPATLEGMPNFRETAPIAGAGRFVRWDQPEVFNRLVRAFIASYP